MQIVTWSCPQLCSQHSVSGCWSVHNHVHACADQGKIHTDSYSLLPVDLRDLDALQSSLESAGFRPHVPTYILAECVLVYMEPHESAALLKHLGQQLPSAVCIVYEQVPTKDFAMCKGQRTPCVAITVVMNATSSLISATGYRGGIDFTGRQHV